MLHALHAREAVFAILQRGFSLDWSLQGKVALVALKISQTVVEWPKNSHLAFQERLQRSDDCVYLPSQWVCAPVVSPHALRNSTRLCISSAVRDAIRRSRRRLYSPRRTAAVVFHRGQREQRLRYGKLATSSMIN
jgi:hypothetical protein